MLELLFLRRGEGTLLQGLIPIRKVIHFQVIDNDHLDPLGSSHPHTWVRYLPMLTFFVLSSVIHGCSSIFQGMPRRLGFFSRLEQDQSARLNSVGKGDGVVLRGTHQLSMKCLKLSLQKIPASGSSFNLGIGC